MFASRSFRSALLLLLVFAGGCRRQLTGYPYPETNELYFPLGVQLSPDGRFAYVLSTNWDQRFNTGWVSVIDIDALVQRSRNAAPDEVPSPNDVVVQQLYVPSLGGEMTLSPDNKYLVATFRNRAQVIVFDVLPDGLLSCAYSDSKAGLNAADRLTACDRFHIYHFTQDGPDYGLIQDQFVDPFSVRFVGGPENGFYTVVIGFLQAFQGRNSNNNNRTIENTGALVSFVDLTPNCDPAVTEGCGFHDLLDNQRSINLSLLTGTQMLASTVVAPYPDTSRGRYVTIAGRGFATSSLTTTTLFNIDLDHFDFYADNTEDIADDVNNLARIGQYDIRTDSGGFNVSDLAFSGDGQRAFLTLSYSQQAAGVSDSVVMLESAMRTDTITLSNDERVQVTRPGFRLLDTIPILGTPQSIQAIERPGLPTLVATATLIDNAVHFVRVGTITLDSLTRIDRQVGEAPTTVRYERFTATGDATPHDYVFIPSFLDHGFNFFDITDSDPARWTQGYVRSAHLEEGNRYR